MYTFPWLLWFACLLGIIVPGVAAQPAPSASAMAPQGVEQQVSQGSVRLTLTTDRQTMGLADRLHLTLTVAAPPDVVLTFPEALQQLGPFRVRSHRMHGPQVIAPDRRHWRQEYTLEVDDVGPLTLPALTVTFQSTDATPGTAPQSLHTTPVTITVTSLVPEHVDLTALKDIAPPIDLPSNGFPAWVWVTVGSLGGLGVGLGTWWYWRWRRAAALAAPQPAHVLALAALRQLQREDLMAQQHIETFYVRLSGILRQYVEGRFGLHAPEQTTEEFLEALRSCGGLLTTHRSLLQTVLEHCDLVKFARHQPAPDIMHCALSRVTRFIEQTADDTVLVAVPPVDTSVL